eukprot:1161094-Pelagomonas_calceolata.AAC.3
MRTEKKHPQGRSCSTSSTHLTIAICLHFLFKEPVLSDALQHHCPCVRSGLKLEVLREQKLQECAAKEGARLADTSTEDCSGLHIASCRLTWHAHTGVVKSTKSTHSQTCGLEAVKEK